MGRIVRAYNTKIIETPTYIEVYQYEDPIFSKKTDEKSTSNLEWLNGDTKKKNLMN